MVGVYAITNIVNGKMYIGQSKDIHDRFAHHISRLKHNRHENDYLQKAWNKYGAENFRFDILEECSIDIIDDVERKYIEEYDTMNRDKGYNFESGGSLNKVISDEVKEKMSKAKIGMYDGDKNPMFDVHLKHSDEWKEWASKRFSGTGNPMYGVHRKLSDEEKKQISDRTKGEKNPFYGQRHTDESRQKISQSKKKTRVLCVETGIEYESSCAAMHDTGIHNGSILRAAKNNLTAGGYHWKIVA